MDTERRGTLTDSARPRGEGEETSPERTGVAAVMKGGSRREGGGRRDTIICRLSTQRRRSDGTQLLGRRPTGE